MTDLDSQRDEKGAAASEPDRAVPAEGTSGTGRAILNLIGLDRFTAFSDGVYAIAITLLVLELTVPEGPERLLEALAEQWHEFLGYLISFAFIGGSWLTHARMSRLMKSADAVVAGINLVVLLLVAVLPFTTSLMAVNLWTPAMGAAVLVYGVNVLLSSVALSLMLVYLGRERSLLVDDVADDELALIVRARWIAIAANLVAISIAIVAPTLAVGLYVLVALTVFLAPLLRLRRRPT
ncbi:MAG: TMEM175 family protein [Candidatus Limnocylindrales bacterium]